MKLPRPAPRHLHALTAALLLGGCASMAPPFDPPPLPVPARYAEDTGPASALPAANWRATFTDQQLQALIAQALANNRDLRTAVLRNTNKADTLSCGSVRFCMAREQTSPCIRPISIPIATNPSPAHIRCVTG